jgi:hypothetical protein
MATTPLSWNDPLFSGMTNSGFVNMTNPGTISNTSITNAGGASVAVGVNFTGSGSFTLNDVRMQGTEGVDIFSGGNVSINNSYIETTGQAGDHADGIQVYAPGTSGNLTVTNTTIVSHNQNATAGVFVADDRLGGNYTFDNVVFDGGPYGLRINADAGPGYTYNVALKDVYFIQGSFGYDPFLIYVPPGYGGATLNITEWDNVRWATIVNGQLVPGALIPPPQPVVGGAPSTPSTPSTPPGAPSISSWSPDTGKTGDGITDANKIDIKGTAAANSTVTVYDNGKQIGTTKADASGSWDYITGVLTDAKHALTATATTSSGTGAASAAVNVTVDTTVAAPAVTGNSVVSTNHVQLSGSAEAGSTVNIYDGTTVVGTGTANASGAWSITTGVLSSGAHALKAQATDVAGNVSAMSQTSNATIPTGSTTTPPPTAPAAPKIVSFSNDTGKDANDHITNDNTLTLSGTAAANSTVKIFDGTSTTAIATVTADGNGQWTVTTPALGDGAHNLTATSTSSGQTSSASAALSVTVDTVAPDAPVITSDSIVNTNQIKASGTAAANSTITVYDDHVVVGSGTADGSGNWTITTSTLPAGNHALIATATDTAGNVSAASQAFDPVTGDGSTSTPTTPSALTGVVKVGNNYFLGSNGPELKYGGGAVATGQFQDWVPISSVKMAGGGYDVAWENSSGQFTFWATDSQGNFQSYPTHGVALAANSTTVESYETIFNQDLNGDHTIGLPDPTAPTPSGLTGVVHIGNNYFLGNNGPELKYGGGAVTTGEFQDWVPISSVQVAGGGYDVAWKNSSGQFTFWAMDSHGNFQSYPTHGVALAGNSTTVESYETIFHQDLNGDHTIGVPGATGTPTTSTTPATLASAVNFSALTESSSNVVTIQGTADAFSQVKMYDGKTYIGSTKAGTDGTWSFTSSSAVSNTVHTFNAVEVDSAGHATASSGSAILGSRGSNTLTSTSGNDLFVGNGHPDTFVFASNFGQDVIKDFAAGSRGNDTIQFSKSVFDSFASVLSHASQVGQDVVILAGDDSLTLKNTKLGALNSHDFHFA